MKIYVNETEIIMEGKQIFFESGYTNSACGKAQKQAFVTPEIKEMIEKNKLKKLPTTAIDKITYRWFEQAVEIIQDYVILNDIFNKAKKEKHL